MFSEFQRLLHDTTILDTNSNVNCFSVCHQPHSGLNCWTFTFARIKNFSWLIIFWSIVYYYGEGWKSDKQTSQRIDDFSYFICWQYKCFWCDLYIAIAEVMAISSTHVDSIESACRYLGLTSIFWASKFSWMSPLPTGDAINH